jgi:large repetitive protein
MFAGANAKCVNRLLVLLVFAASADARAQTAFFAPDPHWESPQPYTTRSVAIGDIDLDGDLDLVCGNSQANTLFLNDAGTIGISSSWFPAGIDRTRNIALGDVDGDGYLDVICGNFDGANTLYLNDRGTLRALPADTLWTDNTAESVALGDMDNDGDLDIVFGIPLFPTAIYFNEGGLFPGPPTLIGGPNETRCVVVGDIDGNGYLDIVQSNFGATACTYVYLNRQSDVDSLPAWSSPAGHQTLGVALADLNGDQRLDLICANFDQPNTIYYHEADSLYATTPSWSSGPADSGEDVEVGDVDGDGDVDLIIANFEQPTALYLNDLSDTGGALTTIPAWGTSRADRTIDTALGDIDGDGDLDLVCGNADELSTVYMNLTPPLELEPSWESVFPAQNRTKSVALGDVDGDGDLDLVCGNGGAEEMVSTCYLNQDGRFETTPSWLSAEPRRTASIALANVNLDDRLDLICGNQGEIDGEVSTAFQNIGGSFSSLPTWTSGPRKVTTSVAVGDINGDGLVDLVCGNGGDSSMVFLNLGSNFDTKPAWASNDTLQTSGIALGDVDGDGDLDLVCGNNGLEDPSTLYLNEGRMFADEPAWSSAQTFFTNDVALGDIDGDGDLDLACANNPQATTVYFNQGGIFAPSAGWSSRPPARPTTSVVLGDLDGDGDLDLVCGNELDSLNVAYLNEHGTLNRDPGWISRRGYDTEDVVLGDIDGDGDLDAVFGNENGPNVLHAGMKNRPVDPSSPLPGQTNHDAFLSQVKVRRIGPNT